MMKSRGLGFKAHYGEDLDEVYYWSQLWRGFMISESFMMIFKGLSFKLSYNAGR